MVILKKRLVGICFVLFLSVMFIYLSSSEDSDSSSTDEWLMFGRTLNRTRNYPGDGPINLSRVEFTTFTAGGDISTAPAISNGYVYIGSDDNYVYQLNASNVSQQIANFSTGGDVESSPAVANGYVYVGSDDDHIYQLNASNISQQIANFSTQYDVDSSPAVANGYVYIGSDDPEEDIGLYQLNASNISQQIANFSLMNFDQTDSSPAIANGYVYIGYCDDNWYGVLQLNASNISQQIANFSMIYDSVTYRSGPAVANGYVYIGSDDMVGEDDNYVYQLNASNISQQIANFSTGGAMHSSPAIANGYVYIGSDDDYVYQLNASNISQQIANFSTGNDVDSSPTVTNLYVYVGSDDDKVYQLSASNISQQIGSFSTIGNIDSSPTIWNRTLYIGSDDNKLYAIKTPETPDVTINTPLNQTYTTNSITFNFTAVDNIEMSTCLYTLNSGTTNFTMSNTTTAPTMWNATNSTMSQGSHTVTAYCNDSSNNWNLTESITFFIDSINPSVNITTPPNNTNATNTLLDINFTRNDTNLETCWYSNDTMNYNITLPSGTNITNVTWAEGEHNITIWCNDTVNNENFSSITFTIDTTAPNITLLTPADAASSTTTEYNFTFNVSDSSNVDNCSLILDGTIVNNLTTISKTVANGIYYSSLSVATYTWSINCTDSLNNLGNSSSRSLTVTSSGTTTPPPGGGGGCTPKTWTCGNWSVCENKTQIRECRSNCATKKTETQDCGEEDEETEDDEEEEEFLIGDWSGCDVSYDFENLMSEIINLNGKQFRLIENSDGSFSYETRECLTDLEVYGKKTNWCGEDYLEIYEKSSNQLLSMIEDKKKQKEPSLNIHFLDEKPKYCDCCFNGLKDAVEEDVDCGGICMPCSQVKEKQVCGFDWAKIFKPVLWILLLLGVYFYWVVEREKVGGVGLGRKF